MSTVNFKINSKNYSVDCGAGQEDKILSIASQIDAKAKNLSSMFGDVDSETLLLMVCILTFGDVSKAKNKIASLEKEVEFLKEKSLENNFDEDFFVDLISKLTDKVKTISSTLSSVNKENDVDSNIIKFK